jgi:hypothetical protein
MLISSSNFGATPMRTLWWPVGIARGGHRTQSSGVYHHAVTSTMTSPPYPAHTRDWYSGSYGQWAYLYLPWYPSKPDACCCACHPRSSREGSSRSYFGADWGNPTYDESSIYYEFYVTPSGNLCLVVSPPFGNVRVVFSNFLSSQHLIF